MLETGVPNLDLILGGGLAKTDVLLIVGPAGAGKTLLSLQIAFHAASAGQNVVYVSTLSENPNRLLRHIRSFSFCEESLIGKSLYFLSIFPLIKEGLGKVTDALIAAVKERQARLVIIDGIMTFRDLHPRATELRMFIYELGAILPDLDATVILTSSGPEMWGGHPFPEFTMSDSVLELGREIIGTQSVRTIKSVKMRGLPHLAGQHSMRIDGSGITVLPRIESLFRPRDTGIRLERMPVGFPELDEMMHGGPLAGSSTLLAGALGVGKTLVSLQYIMEGVRRGEKGLYVSSRETPHQLVDKARLFQIDLESAISSGQVLVLFHPAIDLVADEVAWQVLSNVDRFAPQRVVLDGIAELEQALGDARRRHGFMASLAAMLRDKGITSLFTKEIRQVVGPELDFSDTPLAVLAENIVLLRYIEYRGELVHIISILKMRESAYDHSIREYAVTTAGLKVMSKLESAEGLLTGIARLPSEMRVKRARKGAGPEEEA